MSDRPDRTAEYRQVILLAENYLALSGVDVPNFYSQLRQIQRDAREADKTDTSTLDRLRAELTRKWYMLTPDQRREFQKRVSDADRIRIEQGIG